MDRTPELNAALAKARPNFGDLSKDAIGHYGNYLTLGAIYRAIVPALAEQGLVISHRITPDMVLVCSLRHASGEVLESCLPLGAPKQWQQFGAAKTYAERYLVSGLVGLAGEVDAEESKTALESAAPQARPVAQFVASPEGYRADMTSIQFVQSSDSKKPMARANVQQGNARASVSLFDNHMDYLGKAFLIGRVSLIHGLQQHRQLDLQPPLRVALTQKGQYWNLREEDDLLRTGNPFIDARVAKFYPDTEIAPGTHVDNLETADGGG